MEALSQSEMMTALFSALDDQRLTTAVVLLRRIRAKWPEAEFGTDEDEDVEVLLGALCRHRATVKPGEEYENGGYQHPVGSVF